MKKQSNWLHSLSSDATSYRDARSKLARNVTVQFDVQSCHLHHSSFAVTFQDCAERFYADLLSTLYRELSNRITPLSRIINFSLYIDCSPLAPLFLLRPSILDCSGRFYPASSFYTLTHPIHDYTQSGRSSFYTQAESSNYTETSIDREEQDEENSRKIQNLILQNSITNSQIVIKILGKFSPKRGS